jgi:hypothetical protein
MDLQTILSNLEQSFHEQFAEGSIERTTFHQRKEAMLEYERLRNTPISQANNQAIETQIRRMLGPAHQD